MKRVLMCAQIVAIALFCALLVKQLAQWLLFDMQVKLTATVPFGPMNASLVEFAEWVVAAVVFIAVSFHYWPKNFGSTLPSQS